MLPLSGETPVHLFLYNTNYIRVCVYVFLSFCHSFTRTVGVALAILGTFDMNKSYVSGKYLRTKKNKKWINPHEDIIYLVFLGKKKKKKTVLLSMGGILSFLSILGGILGTGFLITQLDKNISGPSYNLDCHSFLCIFVKLCVFVCLFLWPHSWRMEVPGPGIESKPQLWPTLQLQQHQILNPPHRARDWIYICTATWAAAVGFLAQCATAGTPQILFYTFKLFPTLRL